MRRTVRPPRAARKRRAQGAVRVDAGAVAGAPAYVEAEDGSTGVARRSVTAVDAHTGQALLWHADIEGFDSGHVNALAVVGDRLYVGGEFDSIASRMPRARSPP